MSEMLQKGIMSLSDFISEQFGVSLTDVPTTSNRLVVFVKCFAGLESKHQEEHLIKKEIEFLKQKFNQPSLSLNKRQEYLLILSYCHLIGYDVSFAFIHAITMAQQGDMMAKRTGYLLCSLFFNESHEFALLLVNTIMKDLQSSSLTNECAALVVCCHLVANDDMPSVIPHVVKKLSHNVAIVRKKALQCLYTFIVKCPHLVTHVEPHLSKCLKDNDPGVVWAAVETYLEIAKDNPSPYRYLVPPLINMIELVIGHKMSTTHQYYGVPSPWFLISLIRFVTLLAIGCEESTDMATPTFLKIFRQTESTSRAQLAIIFEVIRSISKMDCVSSELFQQAVEYIGKFLISKPLYLKLSGVRLLSMLVSMRPSTALSQQTAILEVLQCTDPSIQQATLDLLYVMANTSNKQFICQRLLNHASLATKHQLVLDVAATQKNIHDNVMEIIFKFYRDDFVWFVETFFLLLQQAQTNITDTSFKVDQLVRILANKNLKEPISDDLMEPAREKAIEIANQKLDEFKNFPEDCNANLLYAATVVLVKICHMSTTISSNDVSRLLLGLLPLVNQSNLQQTIIFSLVILLPDISKETCDWIRENLSDLSSTMNMDDLFFRMSFVELRAVIENQDRLNLNFRRPTNKNLPLHILDEYVCAYLENGGEPYRRPDLDYENIPRLVDSMSQATNGVTNKNNFEDAFVVVSTDESKSWVAETKEEDLSFFSGSSAGVFWSESGYNQPLPSIRPMEHRTGRSENRDVLDDDKNVKNKELDLLAQQLFQGFSMESSTDADLRSKFIDSNLSRSDHLLEQPNESLTTLAESKKVIG